MKISYDYAFVLHSRFVDVEGVVDPILIHPELKIRVLQEIFEN
jgi:hypothetical protein